MDLYNSILSGRVVIKENANNHFDPFNVLNVCSLSTTENMNNISNFFKEYIDFNKLNIDININKWKYLIHSNRYLLVSNDLTQSILKFSWWICNEILYNQKTFKNIDIKQILKDNKTHEHISIYIHKCFNYSYKKDEYNLIIHLDNDTKIIIGFENMNILE